MADKKMLVDATHPEETRVVVMDGSRLEEYDVEAATRQQLKGNIYLAKVTRVEPSLQAAFVDYGGNRHGFLAFNEIHPDYYQIPVADREALIAEQSAAHQAEETADGGPGEGDPVETLGDDDEDLAQRRPPPSPRHYKIQEVIKRWQILLVQVVKEERGNKGAALTTYLSLAGRYCVLMPNTARGGGISRKITSGTDRRRLKKVLGELGIPEGMAVIVRTAGAERSKAEIKRDYEYLLRLWNRVRELTLGSMAPTLVYEEANLIKRSIRDLYGRDIDEIIVDGEEGYRLAKDFMKRLIPSHAKRVKRYEAGDQPLLQRYKAESQLDATHNPVVQLKSGGYIVINTTEALVAIDVNSGRATRERHIEETAFRTNMEAAAEVARQLRLRDLAGLIVIDFIDMDNSRNQTQVERRLKEAMKSDRAHIQLGRISHFGLLELSRQRLRPSLLETSFETCPHCGGVGVRRTTESTALSILRRIEEEGIARRAGAITVHVPTTVALYVLNQKRQALTEIESRYGFSVELLGDDSLIPPDLRIDRVKATRVEDAVVEAEDAEAEADEDTAEAAERDDGAKKKRRRRPRKRKRTDETAAEAAEDKTEDQAEDHAADQAEDQAEESAGEEDSDAQEIRAEDSEDGVAKKRRRGKRGGRRRSRKTEEAASADSAQADDDALPAAGTLLEGPAIDGLLGPSEAASPDDGESADVAAETEAETEDEKPAKPTRRRAPRRKRATAKKTEAEEPQANAPDVIYAPPPEDADATAASADGGNGADEAPAPRPPAEETLAEEPAGEEPATEEVAAEQPRDDDVPVEDDRSEDDRSEDDQADDGRFGTRVINVGSGAAPESGGERRRGWWQRLLD